MSTEVKSLTELPSMSEAADEVKSATEIVDKVELDDDMFTSSSGAGEAEPAEAEVDEEAAAEEENGTADDDGGGDYDEGSEDEDNAQNEEMTEEERKLVKRFKKSARRERKRRKAEKLDAAGAKRKKSRQEYNIFDDDVEVAGDDEEEEDDDEERELAAEDVDHDMEEAVAARERRRNEEKARWGKSEEDIAEEYERRHQREKLQKTFYQDSGGLAAVMGSNVVMAQSSLLPSIHDPKIFKLKCKVGFELQLVRSLMLKTIDVWSKDGIMKIKSAFTTSVKGYIYVESHSEAFAKEIIKGINFIYQSSFQQIAIKEMTSVVSATLTKRPLKPNQWVRIKRGPLKGDLARVLKLVEGGTKAFIQAVPRPDYSPQDGQGRGSAKKAKSNSLRPQQRLFDVEEARAADMYVARRSHPLDKGMRMYNLCNGEYYLNGFLYKEVNVATYIDDRDAKPRLEELQLFQSNAAANQANAEGAQDAADPQSSFMTELAKQIQNIDDDDSKGTSIFTVGDLVKVTGGDMQNLVARVLEVNDASRIAKIIPYDNSFTTTFDIELDLLVKHIMPGAHVKVVAGKYMGQTGRVVNVNEQNGQNIAAILTDGMNMDIQCNVSHLQMSNEVSVGHGNLMGYELYDLVGLSENENAVVITVGAERLRVINHMGIVKDVLPAEVAGKRNHFSLRGSGFDMSQNPMRVGDTVKVVSGSHANMKGTVKHMFKGTVWLHSTSYLKNSGVFVSKNRSCLVSGSNFATPAMSASYKGVLEPTPSFAPGASPGSSLTGSTGSTPAVASRAGAGSGRGIGRDPIVGKTVKIKSGGFKGLLAQVVDATPTHLSVELLAKLKKVTIERSKAVEVGDQRGRIPDSRYAGANPYARDVNPMATPFHTADTPAYHQGSETPAYIAGSETPMYMDGSATPLAGSRTPGGELDELWNVNDIDRAYVHGNGNSVNTSMQNSPGSSYSASNRQGSFAPSTVSSFQPQTEYSMNSHSQPTGSASGYPVESTPMSVDQQSQYSDCASSVASNVAEVGSYHSGRSASTRMTESSSDTRGSEMASSLPVASHLEWEKNMVVRILGGSNANRMGVLQSEVRSDGTFTVALRTTDGVLTDTLTVHYSDLRLEDVVRRQMAKVLSGKYKGLIGKVMTLKGKDAVVELPQSSPEVIKINNLAWIHTNHR